jgi:hypothetical protein
MPAVFPVDAENMVAKLLFKGSDVNRGTNLKLGLMTNSSFPVADNLVTLAHITEVATSGNPGYAAKTLAPADWVVTGSTATADVSKTSFTATGTWTDTVRGYFVATTGTSPVLLFYQLDGNYSFVNGSAYDITLNVSVS